MALLDRYNARKKRDESKDQIKASDIGGSSLAEKYAARQERRRMESDPVYQAARRAAGIESARMDELLEKQKRESAPDISEGEARRLASQSANTQAQITDLLKNGGEGINKYRQEILDDYNALSPEEKDLAALYGKYGKEYSSLDEKAQRAEYERLRGIRDLASGDDVSEGEARKRAGDSDERMRWLLSFGGEGVDYARREKQYEDNKKRIEELDRQIAQYDTESAGNWKGGPGGLGYKASEEKKAAEKERDNLIAANNVYERMTAAEDTVNKYVSLPDFEQKSISADISSPQEDFNEHYDPGLAIATGAETAYQAMDAGYHASTWENMTEDEKKVWYYKKRVEGDAAAADYLREMDVVAGYRVQEELQKTVSEGGALAKVAASVLSVPAAIGGGAIGFANDLVGAATGSYNPYRIYDPLVLSQTMRSGVTSDMGAVGSFIYNTGMSMAESALGAATMGKGFSVTMGMSAASQTARDLWEKGATDGQILAGAGLAGVAEALFEEISLDRLLDPKSINSVKELVKELVLQGGVEASEEVFTELANIISDTAVRKNTSDLVSAYDAYLTAYGDEESALLHVLGDKAKEVGLAGLGGFLSGAGMGATFNAANYNSTINQRGELQLAENDAEKLRNIAETLANDTTGQSGLSQRNRERLANLAAQVSDRLERGQNAARATGKLDAALESVGEKGVIGYYRARAGQITTAEEAQEYIDEVEDYRAMRKAQAKEGTVPLISDTDEATLYELESRLKDRFAGGDMELTVAEKGTGGAEIEARLQRRANQKTRESALSDYLTTESGQTEYTASEGATPEKVAGKITFGEKGKYVLPDGKSVSAENVTFGDPIEAAVYGRLASSNLSASSKNTIAENVLGTEREETGTIAQLEALRETGAAIAAYNYGELGFFFEEAERAISGSDALSASNEAALKISYNQGTTARIEKYESDLKKAISNSPYNKKKSPGKVVFDSGVSKADLKSDVQKSAYSAVKVLARATGTTIHLYKSTPNAAGEYESANGRYDPKTGDIWIDVNAGANGEGLMLFTAAHEFTHFIRQYSPVKYNALADFLMSAYAEAGEDVSSLVAKQIDRAAQEGRTLDTEAALEEFVADSMEKMLADGEVIKALARENPTLLQEIKSFLADLVKRLTAAYAGIDPDSEEGRIVAGMTDRVKKLQAMYAEALSDAGKNYRGEGRAAKSQRSAKNAAKSQRTVESDVATVDVGTQSVAPKDSLRTWTKSEYQTERQEIARKIARELGVTYEAALKYIDSINSVARLIADDRVRLDYEPNVDPGASVLKPNSEYKWTLDMSTLCAKRLLYTGTFDAIQKMKPDTAFTSEDLIRLREMMMDRGLEVACGICYVESTRREIGPITQDFIDRYKKAQKDGKPISRVNSDGKEIALTKAGNVFYAEEGYTPTLADLNTTDIDRVKTEHRSVYDAYLAYMNARGQAKPKLLETRAEYDGEILKNFKSKTAVKARNDHGGLRVQSFSDFELVHMLDMMQAVMDMSRVGLMSQAYTKVPAFAQVFGGTGMKINLSLIAKGTGLDENGNLLFDNVEGMDADTAFALRDRYSENVGTILVGKNDAHIIAAMADPRIDFIIPFHKSSWKESLYSALGLEGYDDYTAYQNEKPTDPTRKIQNFDPKEYWDFSKTGDENAQAYLELCKKNGRIPKFPQFQSYPGYWKLLIDYKMYSNEGVGSPQQVVRPVFDEAAAKQLLDEYEGGHRKLPVAEDVVRDFIAEYDQGDVKLSSDNIGTFDRSESDIRYQERRKSDQRSEREILSTALLETAANEGEREALVRYQRDAAKYDELDAHLANVKAQIKELSFAPGKRDTAKLAELRDERIRTENRLNIYDGRLLKLESTKAMRDLVVRAKEQTARKLRAEYVAREGELRREKNAAANRKVSAVRDEYRERIANLRSNERAAELRERISNVATRLRQRLLRPAENKFVTRELIRPVAEILSLVDHYDGKSQALGAKAQALATKYEALQKGTAEKQSFYDGVVQDVLYAMRDVFGEESGGEYTQTRSVRALSEEQLQTVYQAASTIEHLVTASANAISTDEAISLYDLRRGMIEEANDAAYKTKDGGDLLNKKNAARKYLFAHLRPKAAFDRIGGYRKNGAWSKAYRILDEGQNKQLRIEMEANALFDDVMPGKGKKHTMKEFRDFTSAKNLVDVGLVDDKGRPYRVSHDLLAALALHLKNADNAAHILRGGLTAPNLSYLYGGKASDAYTHTTSLRAPGTAQRTELVKELQSVRSELAKNQSDEDAGRLRERARDLESEIDVIDQRAEAWLDEVAQQVDDALTDYDREWIDAWENFAEYSKNVLNEATQRMYGFDRANVENYFPISTDRSYGSLGPMENLLKDFTLEGIGFMKERTGGVNPIRFDGITSVAQSHIRQVSRYAGMAPAIRDFSRAYGGSLIGYTTNVQETVGRAFGNEAKDYITNLLADLNGARESKSEHLERLLAAVRGNKAAAVLTMNPNVAMAQSASYPAAAAVVGWKPLLKALASGGKSSRPISRADTELIAKYSPLLWYRSKGYSTVEAGEATSASDRMGELQRKARYITGWINAFDQATVGRLWYAAQYYVDEQSPALEKGSDEYYEEVARIFNRVVEETQPNYTTLQRPDILRSTSSLMRTLTMFMTQRMQNFNIMYDAAGRYTKYRSDYAHGRNGVTKADVADARRGLVRAVSSQVAAAASIVAFKTLSSALLHNMDAYRDDDDELTALSVSDQLLDMFFESLASSVLGGSEIYSLIRSMMTGERFYGVSVNGLDSINDILDGVLKLTSTDGDKWAKAAYSIGKQAAEIFGIPASNAEKIAKGTVSWAREVEDGDLWNFETGVERKQSVQGHRLYEAVKESDPQKEQQIIDEVGSSKKADSALKTYLRAGYKTGEVSRADVEKIYRDRFGYDDDDVYWLFDELDAKKDNESDYGKYNDFYEAVSTGQNLRTVIKRYTDNGVEAKTLAAGITNHFKDQYAAATTAEKAKLKGYLLNAYVILGYSRSDSSKKIDEWK